MKPSEVPEELIDLAMTGAKPGCRGDAAFYLANVLPAHERQVRERVAAESAVLDPKDLAELLNYVIGREGIRVVQEETLDRAFAALKATQRGES